MSKSVRHSIREIPLKSKDYENSVNRYASWAYQETFLVFLMNFLGFTINLKKNKEGNTHRFARIQSIFYQIDNITLQSIMAQNNSESNHMDFECQSNSTDCDAQKNNFGKMENEIHSQNNENIENIENNENIQNNENNENLNENEMIIENENNENVENTQNIENNEINKNYSDVTESHSFICENNQFTQNNYNYYNNFINQYNNVKIDYETNTTHFILFEDTEYFESICSSQQKRVNGSKNINDFAKMCSLFLMYFFNTFGIEFKIKGEGKTFPMITEIKFRNESISNSVIQEFGKRHFSEMVRGNQLAPEFVLMEERDNDEHVYNLICSFLMSIQQAVYSNVKEYLCFIQFISKKFFNLYCNDDRESVLRMLQESDECELKYMANNQVKN